MSGLRFVSVFFLFCFFSPYLAANNITVDKFEETAGKGLIIRTNPHGVRVFIDGADRGLTPLTLDNIPPGEYHIRLHKDGYSGKIFNVTLFDTSRLVVSVRMTEVRGYVSVTILGDADSTPQNPHLVYASTLDDTLRTHPITENKNAPVSPIILHLPSGYRTITARAFGWEDETVTVLVDNDKITNIDINMKRAAFNLRNASQSRRRFNPSNPGNLGATEYRFEVTAPGEGTLVIYDSGGSVIYEKQLAQFDARVQRVTWNGNDSEGSPVPEGVYTAVIEASGTLDVTARRLSLTLETEINYSAGIFPQSADSGFSGLVFTPSPAVLSAGSYQFSASLLTGSFPAASQNNAHDAAVIFPFKIDMRISPIKNLEITAAFNINPYLEDQTGWGLSGSAKYIFFNGENFPLAFAAGFSYSWAGKNGEYPVSPGKGAQLILPFSLELKPFFLIFCPAAFWRGPEGFIPELHLGAGILYRGGFLNAGLSYRCEFNLENKDINDTAKHLAGAEFHITISNLVISLRGGIWSKSGQSGGFGGTGVGLIF